MKLTEELLAQLPWAIRAEIDENIVRKELTQSELAAIQQTIMELVAKDAKPGKRTDLTSGSKDPEVTRASEVVGRLFGEGEKQVRKRIAIVEAATIDPEKFGKLKDDMDRTGRVGGVYNRLMSLRQAEQIRAEPPPLPQNGPYRVIVADPPWLYDARNEDASHRGTPSYPQMSVAEICAMPVAAMAHDDCVLWLWTTNAHMRYAFDVIDAWGFEQKTILTWVKQKMGLGSWLRGQTEHCLLAIRGKPTVRLTNETTVLVADARAHSQKPEEFYALVERLCPAPRYAELFSRQQRENWDGHGNELSHRAASGGTISRVSAKDTAGTDVNGAVD